MSDRLLKLLVGALAVLVVAWAAARFLSGRGERPRSAPFTLAADGDLEIDSAVVIAGDDTIRLRAGDGWTVNGYEAVPDAGESLERAIQQARIGRLVSRNPENHERLGVTEEKGRRLTVFADGAAAVSLIQGDRAGRFDRAYVRRPGEDEVYELEGTLVSLVNRRVDDWRNREILAASRDEVAQIEFTYPDASFALVRDSLGWRLEPSGARAKEDVVSSLLTQLTPLRAIGFAADSVADTLTWEPPAGRVRVLGPGDAELGAVTFIERSDVTGYYVRRDGSPVVFTLSSWTGKQILKREDELAEEEKAAAAE
jgi:hypothetical protein